MCGDALERVSVIARVPRPGIEPMSSALAGRFLTTELLGKNPKLLLNGQF